MEELRKWEETQKIILLMEDYGFPFQTAPTSSSHRFLAELLIFLAQPCGDFNANQKLYMTFYAIREISASLIEEASLVLGRKFSHLPPIEVEEKSHADQLQPREDIYYCKPFVGMDAMERANSTLEDFCRSYFMFHNLDVSKPQDLFKHLPVLSFTEGYIYQIDAINEKSVDVTDTGACFEERIKDLDDEWLKRNPFEPLSRHLQHCGLMTQRIEEELKKGEEYWYLERKLCSALANQKEIQIDDAMRAISLKSFDYRVLNLLLYQLRGETVNELHMDFLSVSELLVEISDDLYDYEATTRVNICRYHFLKCYVQEDVLDNNFNILRMLVSVYGTSKAPEKLLKCITEAEKKFETSLKSLEHELAFLYQKRCKEASRDGGFNSGNSFGTWTLPHLIPDEKMYRLDHRAVNC